MDPISFGSRTIQLYQGSVLDAASNADAIVSSDDNYLSHGGGVSKQIWGAFNVPRPPVRPTLSLCNAWPQEVEAVRLRHVIHAVTIDFDRNTRVERWSALALYRNVLESAGDVGCSRLAMPLLGVGAAGMAVEDSTLGLIGAMDVLASNSSPLREVVLAVLPPQASVVAGVLNGRAELAALADNPAALLHTLHDVVVRTGEEARAAWAANPVGTPPSGLRRAGDVWMWEPPLHELPARVALDQIERVASGAGKPLAGAFRSSLWSAVNAAEALSEGSATEASLSQLTTSLAGMRSAPHESSQHAIVGSSFVAQALASAAIAGPVGMAAYSLFKVVPYLVRASAKKKNMRHRQDDTPETTPSMLSEATLPTYGQHLPQVNAPVRADPEQSGNAAVRRLRDLLLERLPSHELDDLLGELELEGYRGERDYQLLEYCVRAADPVEVLTARFTKAGLRPIYADKTGRDGAGLKHETLAHGILQHLGFPIQGDERSLDDAHRMVAAARVNVMTAKVTEEVSGQVTRVAAELEYLCTVFARFLCQVLFNSAADPWLRARGRLDEGRQLQKAGLGTLLDALEFIGKAAESDPTLQGPDAFRRALRERRLLAPGHGALAKLRNAFAHCRGPASGELPAARSAAHEFMNAAGAFLRYLSDPETRVFPMLVRVERIETDRWGRRVVHATREGGERESIFSDQPLAPGEVYFMHPLSNPFRVDPILVPRGTLTNQSD